jgi:hypothetical protein
MAKEPEPPKSIKWKVFKDLKLLERTVGKRLIRNVTVLDVQHWYDEWRKPETENSPERIDRAHDGVAPHR